jgi:hypothetical protein
MLKLDLVPPRCHRNWETSAKSLRRKGCTKWVLEKGGPESACSSYRPQATEEHRGLPNIAESFSNPKSAGSRRLRYLRKRQRFKSLLDHLRHNVHGPPHSSPPQSPKYRPYSGFRGSTCCQTETCTCSCWSPQSCT